MIAFITRSAPNFVSHDAIIGEVYTKFLIKSDLNVTCRYRINFFLLNTTYRGEFVCISDKFQSSLEWAKRTFK